MFRGGKCSKQDLKTIRATDTNKPFICASFFHLSNLLSKATDKVYQRKAEQTDTVSEPAASFVCASHSTCLWGFHMQLLAQRWAAQIPFQPSACQTPLYLPNTERTRTPVQSQPNSFTEPSVWPDTYIPPLVQPRKSQNCILRLGTQRTEPLLNHRWPRICPSSVSPLPSCTVRCHL